MLEKKLQPKYRQVTNIIISDIQSGIYKSGDQIPSINKTSEEMLLSRDTVEKAYKLLRHEGILSSVPGIGFYVANNSINSQPKICVLFNKLSNYKKETYDSFAETLRDKAILDLYVYNYNLKVFERIITENLHKYDFFVIVPHFHPGSVGLEEIVKKIPKEKVLIIDKKINRLIDSYPTVYQDFEQDIQDALKTGLRLIKKYRRLILAYPLDRFYSREIHLGFNAFCKRYAIPHKIIDKIEHEELYYKDAYVVISDDDLVVFIKKAQEKGLIIGKDVGVVSYNENPVKEILEGGITTISTNHKQIGHQAALMMLNRSKEKIKIPFVFNRRKSL
jgi:DNA-binding transcriptional regulator YhcF (GntR family)